MSQPQTYANHRRLEPLQHFFLTPVFLTMVIVSFVNWFKHPTLHSASFALVAVALLLLTLQVRMYALKVQDRLIRLEESRRMERVLPQELKSRIPELSVKQMVGLRFAVDAELADRVREALDQNLGGEAIKKRIQTWRPDTNRV
jgi:hypothetical protein